MQAGARQADPRTRVVLAVLKAVKLPPRFRLKLVKDDPVRLELTLTPAYGKDPILVGLVESQDLVARRDREGASPGICKALGIGRCATARCRQAAGTHISKKPCKRCLKPGFRRLFTKKPPARLTTQWTARGTCADERKCCAFQPFETGCEQLRQLPHAGATTESLRPLGSLYVFRRCWWRLNSPPCRFGPPELSGFRPGVVDCRLKTGSPSPFSPRPLLLEAASQHWPKTRASLEPTIHRPPRH